MSTVKEFVSQVPQVISVTIGTVVVLSVLMFTSCTMVISESGEEAAAKVTARAALEKQRSTAIEKLISKHGINPITARCAILGWNTGISADRTLCKEAAKLPVNKVAPKVLKE